MKSPKQSVNVFMTQQLSSKESNFHHKTIPYEFESIRISNDH